MYFVYTLITALCFCALVILNEGVFVPSLQLILTNIAILLIMLFCVVNIMYRANKEHFTNCTCEECTPIEVKKYCPCGCGQYEIVYR